MFFQVLLLILAIAFTVGIRYAVSVESTQAGSFGKGKVRDNITVAEAISRIYPEVEE